MNKDQTTLSFEVLRTDGGKRYLLDADVVKLLRHLASQETGGTAARIHQAADSLLDPRNMQPTERS